MVDRDGAELYETESSALKLALIRNDDAALLEQYLEKRPCGVGPGVVSDPEGVDHFALAASLGSANALRVMLEQWAAHPPSEGHPAKHHRSWLLGAACSSARIEAALLLLDENQPWARDVGSLHGPEGTENGDGTHYHSAILAAAQSYEGVPRGDAERRRRSEDMMHLLLDRGACARDCTHQYFWGEDPNAPARTYETVLTLAMAGASDEVIHRLIDGGADVHGKTTYPDMNFDWYSDCPCDVTPLHIGSLCFNPEGIQALLDRRGAGVAVADMVSSRDDSGRTPLHWAARSWLCGRLYPEESPAGGERCRAAIAGTIELLLSANPDAINARDAAGDTPLHHAVRSHTADEGRDHVCRHYDIVEALIEHGADASARGSKDQTPLHRALLNRPLAHPTDAALFKLLVADGAGVGDADSDGRTALHYAARCLGDPGTARFLLDQAGPGDDSLLLLLLGAADARGNTPLHVAAAEGDLFRADQRLATPEDRIRAQDEMMRALVPPARAQDQAGGGRDVGVALMDRRNADGKTPRELREERRRMWRQDYCEAERARAASVGMIRGRGRGRGRGQGRGRGAIIPTDPSSPW